MANILGSWSGMRKHLEQEMLAPCLAGRVRYHCTTYPGMDDCKIFEIFIDNTLAKRFSLETVNTYFINNGISVSNGHAHPMSTASYWDGFWETLSRIPIADRTEFTDSEFCDALAQYRNQSAQASIHSENPLVKMFALLDRRIGKRTLLSIKESLPDWLLPIWTLRLDGANRL